MRTMATFCAVILSIVFCTVTLATEPGGHQLYIDNASDRPIRIFFLNDDISRSFCVVKIRTGSNVSIENVSNGHWQVLAVELVKQQRMNSVGMHITQSMDSRILNITGEDGVYELTLEKP
jgi:hypothetical protein